MAHRSGFAEHVLAIVADIPPGKVMTYGGVAAELGSQGAQAVGNIMSRSGDSVPWWRVVQASGRVARGHETDAIRLLHAEGTPMIQTEDGWRVLMSQARHTPQ